jgi:DNA-binding transcriptional LysR family regulator
MTVFEIEAFLAIVQYGSFTKASEKLHISQPAISKRIALLEEELGYKLIVRKNGVRTIKLTDQGISFISIAEQWISIWESAQNLKFNHNKDTFHISSSDGPLLYVLSDAIKILAKNAPEVNIKLSTLSYGQSYKKVQNGSIDMALTGSNYFYRDVRAVPAYSEKMVFICRVDSDYSETVEIESLLTKYMIFSNYSSDYELWFKQWFKTQQKPFIETDLNAQLEDFMASFDKNMWSIVPMTVARKLLKNPLITSKTLTATPPDRIVYYIHKLGSNSKHMKVLLQLMKDSLVKLEGVSSFL